MDRIPKIFVINLPHRTDRLESIRKELDRMGCLDKLEVVEGVQIYVGALGTAGVAEARARCLDIAKERGYEMIMILEDDCKFLVEKHIFHSEIETFLNTAPPEWTGLWFGSFWGINYLSDSNWLVTYNGVTHDTATLIHSRFYDQLIEGYRYCRDKYIETQDEQYNTDFWLGTNNIKVYLLKQKLCAQADCYSDRTNLVMNGGASIPL